MTQKRFDPPTVPGWIMDGIEAQQRTPANGITACWLGDCREPSHVVMFASGAQLCGQETFNGKKVAFCLKHGGQIYDVIKHWSVTETNKSGRNAVTPTWLVDDFKADRLPRLTPDRRGWVRRSETGTWRANEFRRSPANRSRGDDRPFVPTGAR